MTGQVEVELREAVDVYLAIGRVVRTMRRFGDSATLTPGSASALATLTWSGPMRLSDLAAAERVSAPTMSRIVGGLERSGFVQRMPDPADGRAHLLTPTDQGRTLATGMKSARIERIAEALDRLEPAQRASLLPALTAFERALDE
jgi:DNA-binding MarR family transcriptional regulator